jgi:hypothetical protein
MLIVAGCFASDGFRIVIYRLPQPRTHNRVLDKQQHSFSLYLLLQTKKLLEGFSMMPTLQMILIHGKKHMVYGIHVCICK